MARKVDAKGRNQNGVERFISLRRSLLHSPQFSALSPTSRALFVELQALFNGTNNGAIFLSCIDAADRMGLSCLKAVCGAFDELRDMGFITETIGSSFSLKAGSISKARAWNLNWINKRGARVGPDCLPPLDFTKLSAKQKRRVEKRQGTLRRYLGDYQQGKFAVEESSMLEARKAIVPQVIGGESSMLNAGNGEKPPKCSMEESSIYINTMGFRGRGWLGGPVLGPVSHRIALSEKIGPFENCGAGLLVTIPPVRAPAFCELIVLRRSLGGGSAAGGKESMAR